MATDIICVLRYKRHFFMAQGIHPDPVAQEFLQYADGKQQCADQIATRITQLGSRAAIRSTSKAARSWKSCGGKERHRFRDLADKISRRGGCSKGSWPWKKNTPTISRAMDPESKAK